MIQPQVVMVLCEVLVFRVSQLCHPVVAYTSEAPR